MRTSIRCSQRFVARCCSVSLGRSARRLRAAFAQTDQSVETVVVTGSRLPQQNLYSARPLTAISPEEIKFEGTTDVLSAHKQSAGGVRGPTSTPCRMARGESRPSICADLGAKRTLVTINGSRLMPGDPVASGCRP